jgi:hypothetical protein
VMGTFMLFDSEGMAGVLFNMAYTPGESGWVSSVGVSPNFGCANHTDIRPVK